MGRRKKTDLNIIHETSKGILNDLSDMNDLQGQEAPSNNKDKKIKISVKKEKEEKEEKEERHKRSFMLTDKQISLLYELQSTERIRQKCSSVDLSSIVGDAIERYHKYRNYYYLNKDDVEFPEYMED